MANDDQTNQEQQPGTTTSAAGAQHQNSPPDDPQLSPEEQIGAVAIVVSAMIVCLFIIIAWWPDGDLKNRQGLYLNKPFHVHAVDTCKEKDIVKDTAKTLEVINKALTTIKLAVDKKNAEILELKKQPKPDTGKALKTATEKLASLIDSVKKLSDQLVAAKKVIDEKAKIERADPTRPKCCEHACTIQLSNLLLILVAAAGFLGNLIHVSKSLTFYIGMKQFQRSWIAWYFIKPFTASGLALLIYFATNSTGDAKSPVNLFAIMLTAGLAGLFTDIATQKLKAIFEAVLKPADTHPPTPPMVKTMSVDLSKLNKIDATKENNLEIPGQNLDAKNLIVTILGKPITELNVTDKMIKFQYNVSPEDQTKTDFELIITDKTGKVLGKKTL